VTEQGGSIIKAEFRQSSFQGSSVSSMERVQRSQAGYIPPVTRNRELLTFLFERVNGERSLEMVARELSDKYPDHFADWQKAMAFAANAIEQSR
jgi:hypothetical protein